MKILIIFLVLALSGCVNIGSPKHNVAHNIPPKPPQLWSHHVKLSISAEECGAQGLRALKSLGYNSTVKSGNYSYGNFGSNRAAVKCVTSEGGSFVYAMVAGPNKKQVEKLRNELAKLLVNK